MKSLALLLAFCVCLLATQTWFCSAGSNNESVVCAGDGCRTDCGDCPDGENDPSAMQCCTNTACNPFAYCCFWIAGVYNGYFSGQPESGNSFPVVRATEHGGFGADCFHPPESA